MSYIVLSDRWCNIIVLNVLAPSKEKVVIQKRVLCRVSIGFQSSYKHHIKIRLGDFNTKLWRKYIFNPTIWNDSLHQDSADNGVRIVDFAT
jgi:hypothetical protein